MYIIGGSRLLQKEGKILTAERVAKFGQIFFYSNKSHARMNWKNPTCVHVENPLRTLYKKYLLFTIHFKVRIIKLFWLVNFGNTWLLFYVKHVLQYVNGHAAYTSYCRVEISYTDYCRTEMSYTDYCRTEMAYTSYCRVEMSYTGYCRVEMSYTG
jgi:hypothetical protein